MNFCSSFLYIFFTYVLCSFFFIAVAWPTIFYRWRRTKKVKSVIAVVKFARKPIKTRGTSYSIHERGQTNMLDIQWSSRMFIKGKFVWNVNPLIRFLYIWWSIFFSIVVTNFVSKMDFLTISISGFFALWETGGWVIRFPSVFRYILNFLLWNFAQTFTWMSLTYLTQKWMKIALLVR